MIKIKICGITREGDAEIAVSAGAVALGFIFAEQSQRSISRDHARSIIRSLPPRVVPIGVFVNAPRDEILQTIDATGIRCVQLHGDEPPEETAGLPVPVWKAFRVGKDFRCEQLTRYSVDAYLLDARVEGKYGGTGQAFDWSVAAAASQYGQIVVSGGITPENILSAVEQAHPYAIDVNSGVESAPGIKNKDRLLRLFEVLRNAQAT